jgi:hypothetical protein
MKIEFICRSTILVDPVGLDKQVVCPTIISRKTYDIRSLNVITKGFLRLIQIRVLGYLR